MGLTLALGLFDAYFMDINETIISRTLILELTPLIF